MKVYTCTGRKVKIQPSTYDRFIKIHIELGKSFKEARYEWRFFILKLAAKSQTFNDLCN